MRNIFFATSILLFSSGVWAADPEASATNGFSKADFRSEIATPKLRKLLGVANGNLYISKQEGGVEVVDKDGKTLMTLSAKSGDTDLLKRPEAVSVTNDTIYVVDSKTNQVVMYDLATGKYLGRFGSKSGGSLAGEFALDEPQGLIVYEGVVYVADTGNGRIQMYGINGVFLSTLTVSATPASVAEKEKTFKLHEPTDIALDTEGRIYVRDADDRSVKIYAPSGLYQRSLPKAGKPVGLRVAEDGVYVADEASVSIQKYDLDGNLA